MSLLATGKLRIADNFIQNKNLHEININRIMLEHVHKNVDFVFVSSDQVSIYHDQQLKQTIDTSVFESEAHQIYSAITQGSGSFEIPQANHFLDYIGLERIVASSTNVVDLKMKIADQDEILRYSIKSYLGHPPTLLNASGATNFVFEVININDNQMEEINKINTRTKIIDRINKIDEYHGKLVFHSIDCKTFSDNLKMINPQTEDILAHLLLYSYCHHELDCRTIVDSVLTINPLHLINPNLYKETFSQFLIAKALGMKPNQQWNGIHEINGGYIVVQKDGSVLTYSLDNYSQFENYLLSNTKLERPSTTRHNYAYLYKHNGKMFIKFNLQIRFK